MPTDLDLQLLPSIIDDLARQGWSRQTAVLPDSLTHELACECRSRGQNGALNPAGVGRGSALAVREGIRGDQIQWLEAGQQPACDRYLAAMDELRQALNQAFFLGLADYESHFALYPPGAFYQKHLDRFRDDDRRTVSAVFYLNDNWQPEQGGALRIYPADGALLDLLPEAGSLVLFMSAELPHEVLPASRERLSLTGWFRRR
ncbi:2OG-Fe(II) oxygenase [Aquipseudomonas guryensis]|jgi:SM-20-related protein|uniref:2OG-Fe(II) oxygenase n=1 Tax=Aquipseudomonas guryensis TaxID=2759165 RepID=A0A7W4DA65_9GAMM|nr:2OG-Fe(II) oxygenase [Pseudomonas guryensis]MBB1518851.1 2OG-Fe(II) oxygenase [Pseudomonas guryensis]